MPNNALYPLIYKPGLKKDGTLFQADYCTNGQWVRFQRGNIKKMGGMKGIINDVVNGKPTTSNITILPETGNNSRMIVYVANSTAINRILLTQDFSASNLVEVYNLNNPNIIWKSEIIIQGNNKRIVFLGASNLSNINDSSNSLLIAGDINGNLQAIPNLPNLQGLSGLLFASNYLFVYGANGLVQWSKLREPTDFTNADQRNITISNDQVVDAKSIRGGTNSPTILFWTLSSVVRCINTPDAGGNLQFQIDVISKSSSILSSRCVVEYDGLFFWPGTNRFFQYNGIVQELSNTMNLNYFFDNLDMDRRQQVVGVKNTKYGEIWWFYPEKANAPDRNLNVPDGANSRAIIYNIRENAWYDTYISRSAAAYTEDFGFMSSYGRPLSSNIGDNNQSLFRHEFESLTRSINSITEDYTIDGLNIQRTAILAYFTTPVFSWAAFNPMKQLTGNDRWMFLTTIEPDFILTPFNGTGLTVTVHTRQYAQNVVTSSPAYTIPVRNTQDALSGKIDVSFQGRHMTLVFTSNSGANFEMGHIMLSLGIGDGK